MFVTAYVALIVAVNYGFSVLPMVSLPNGEMFPPMTLVVGLIFVLRDFAQREVGHYVLIAMLVGGVISYFMADPYVAIASVIAFSISEIIDWLVYTVTARPFRDRLLVSSAASTPVDSAIFLLMIGAFSTLGFLIMVFAKMIAAVFIWCAYNYRRIE